MISADTVVLRCSEVFTSDVALGLIPNSAIAIEHGRVVWVGPQSALSSDVSATKAVEIDAGRRAVVPGFVDAHTHLVFAGNRREEFASRAEGTPYDASGINMTVAATRAATAQELLSLVRRRADEMLRHGTTTLEAKSGYELSVEGEVRLLKVLRTLNDSHHIDLDITFMGAHSVPPEFEGRADDYIDLVCEMIPSCVNLARWCDVFCDAGAFNPVQSRRVLQAGSKSGLLPRIHANELAASGGVEVAIAVRAASADHLLHLTEAQARALAKAGVAGTICPVTALGLGRMPPARMMIEQGMTIAIASDFNPGTACTGNLQFAAAIATRSLGIGPTRVLSAMTSGGAASLRRSDIGRIAPGCLADILVLDADSHLDLGYRAGTNLVSTVIKRGKAVLTN